MCVCVCVYVPACVPASVRARVHMYVCGIFATCSLGVLLRLITIHC